MMDTPPLSFQHRHRVVLVLSLTAMLLGTFAFWYEWRKFVHTNDAIIDGFKIRVAPDFLARVVELYVDEGALVKQGQLIALLDGSILETERDEAAASVKALEEKVSYQRFLFEKIRNDFYRAEKAYKDLVIPFQDYDHAQKDYEMAKAGLAMVEAERVLAQAQLEVTTEKLQHCRIYAPRDAMIAKRWAMAGDVLQPGQALFTLNDIYSVWVLANLDETKVAPVKIGDPVEIHVDAYPGKTFTGKVWVVQGAAASQFSLIPQDNATGNYTKVAQRVPIKITLDAPPLPQEQPFWYLFPGMSVEVKIRVR